MTFVNQLRGYKYIYSSLAIKNLKKLSVVDVKKIDDRLKLLVKGAQNLDVKKLSGYQDSQYRLRVGCYRIIYQVYESKLIVLIVRVKHRKEAYKK